MSDYTDPQLDEAVTEYADRLVILTRARERGEDLGWVFGWDLDQLHALALEVNRRRDLDAHRAETLYDSAGDPVKTTVWGIRATELAARDEARLEAFADVVEALGLEKARELVVVISGGDTALATDLWREHQMRDARAKVARARRSDWDPRAAFEARLARDAETELRRMHGEDSDR